jgi:hypothetical protein
MAWQCGVLTGGRTYTAIWLFLDKSQAPEEAVSAPFCRRRMQGLPLLLAAWKRLQYRVIMV